MDILSGDISASFESTTVVSVMVVVGFDDDDDGNDDGNDDGDDVNMLDMILDRVLEGYGVLGLFVIMLLEVMIMSLSEGF